MDMLVKVLAEEVYFQPVEIGLLDLSRYQNVVESQVLLDQLVKESESLGDEGPTADERKEHMIREVLGRDDAPEDIFIKESPRIHRRNNLLWFSLHLRWIWLVVLFFIPHNVVGAPQTLHELTEPQCGY